MKTVIIHGVSHKGSTYHIAHSLGEKLGGELKEFFLPKDFGEFCVACLQCFGKDADKCPHYEKLKPLTDAIDEADVVILDSPVYVFHATGAMKAFLDHYGYRWLPHRPDERMFHKQGVCISTAAGAGMSSTNKDMADSLFFWGVARIYRLGWGVAAINWDMVSDKKKAAIDKKTSALAKKILARSGNVTPTLKTKLFFNVMRQFQKKGYNQRDMDYWKEKGWMDSKRPWK